MDQSEIGAQMRAISENSQQTAAQPQGCKACQRSGLPILPLRYAVVAKDKRKGAGPALHTTLGKGVSNVALPGGTHEYALRTLREGYVYVLLDQKIWQGYEVTDQGHLRQFDPFTLPRTQPAPLVARCRDEGHDIPAGFLNIDTERYKSALVAFAQDPWTKTVLDEYKSGKRPRARFLQLDLAKLQTAPDTLDHTFEIDRNLNRLKAGVEEFVKDAQHNSSVHGFYPRHDRVKQYFNHLDKLKKNPKTKFAAIVLMDPAGMVQELNAARLSMIEKRQTYASHPYNVRRQMVSNSILGLKKIMAEPARVARVYDFASDDQDDNLPALEGSGRSIGVSPAEEAEQTARATWAKMEKFYSEPKRELFAYKYQKDLENFQKWIDLYGKDYSAWAGRLDWINLFTDYDSRDVKSSMMLTCMAAPCLSGGPTDQATLDLWKKWLAAKPNDASNPVYRALFGDRKELLEHFTPQGGSQNKTDQLYDTIKGLADSKEFEKLLKEPLLIAVSHIQLALAGAASLLGDKLGPSAEAIQVRAQQAALRLYAKTDVTLLKVKMTVGEYQKLLSEVAFKKLDKAVAGLLKEGGRTVKSMALGGILSIDNPKVRNTMIEVTIWSLERAEVIQRELAQLSRSATSMGGATVGRIKLHALNLSGEAAKALGQIEKLAVNAVQVSTFTRREISVGLRATARANVVLAVGAGIFQGWSFIDSMKDVRTKFGAEKNEALASLASAGFGVAAATFEAAGLILKNSAKPAASIYLRGIRLIKFGGYLAAASAFFDGMEAFLAGGRAWGKGDKLAGVLYFASSGFFMLGSVATGVAAHAAYIGGFAALLGPLGIALALLAIGALLFWAGKNAESTELQIWLARSAFGIKGKRTEKQWEDTDFVEEMDSLNTLMIGLKAELIWEDKIGMDGIQTNLTFPNFDIQHSFYEYTISAKDKKGAWISAAGGKYDSSIANQHYSWVAPNTVNALKFVDAVIGRSPSNKTDVLVIRDFRLDETLFTDVKVAVRYLPVKANPEALAALTVTRTDED